MPRRMAVVALLLGACTSNTVRTVTLPDSVLLDPSQPRTPPVVTITAAGVDKAGYICSFRDGLQPGNVAFKGILVVY